MTNQNLLLQPVRITEQVWSEDTPPLVSISCITYNHEAFIRECLEGFLMQETTFPVEILIHDDASTDRTPEIVREYASKYPHLIKPIYQIENQFSKGKKISFEFNFPRIRGQYVAMCEGDDYWSDPKKLYKQYTYMNKDSYCVLCYHNVSIFSEANAKDKQLLYYKQPNRLRLTFSDLIKDMTIHTSSIFFRYSLVDKIPSWFNLCPMGDWPLVLFLLDGHERYAGYIDCVMSSYRRHSGGYWAVRPFLNRVSGVIKTYDIVLVNFPKIYSQEICRARTYWYFIGFSSADKDGKYISACRYLIDYLKSAIKYGPRNYRYLLKSLFYLFKICLRNRLLKSS